MRREHAPYLLSIVLFLLAACGGSDSNNAHDGGTDGGDTDGGGQAGDTIGPKGGELTAGGVTVTIPAGALEDETEVALEVGASSDVKTPEEYKAVTDVIRLTPHGLEFKKAVTITVPLSESATGAASALYLADDDDTSWEVLGNASINGSQLTFQTTHFSLMEGAVDAADACDPACSGNDVCIGGECVAAVPNACGPAEGYAINSPWPTVTGCERNTRRTSAVGPGAEPSEDWTWIPSTNGNTEVEVLGPVIDADGNLYIVSNYDLIKLKPDGTEAWRKWLKPTVERGEELGAAPPVLVADGNIVVCRLDGHLVKYSSADGSILWDTDAACFSQSGSIPLVAADGSIRTASGQMSVAGATGNKLWSGAPADFMGCAGTPVLDDDGTLYCVEAFIPNVVAVSDTGTVLWRGNINSSDQNVLPKSPVLTSYSVDSDLYVGVWVDQFVPTTKHSLRLYPLDGPPNMTPGDPDLVSLAEGVGSSLVNFAVTKDNAFIAVLIGSGTTGGVQRYLDTGANALDWTSETAMAQGGATPLNVIAAPQPIIDGDGNIYYISKDRNVVSLNEDGDLNWEVLVKPQNPGTYWLLSPAIGPDGHVYVVSDMGPAKTLHALQK